jgi:hypothetical protein
MQLSPIALFVYNRLEHTLKTVEALKKNKLAPASELIIFSDGFKNEADKIKVDEIRKYLKSINGFKTVKIVEKDKNYGLAKSIIAGVTEVVNEYEKIIVLEDDLLTSPYFLKYMNEALDFYKDNQAVISISGYAYPVKTKLPETYFLRGADCWGWATWKRGWNLFESDGKKLLEEIINKKLSEEFDYGGSYPYTKMLRDQISGLVDSWAIRWHASAFINDKLTLCPGKSLVENIGFDNSGTNSSSSNKYNSPLYSKEIKIENIPTQESAEVRKIMADYFKNNFAKPPFLRRIMEKIKKYF